MGVFTNSIGPPRSKKKAIDLLHGVRSRKNEAHVNNLYNIDGHTTTSTTTNTQL